MFLCKMGGRKVGEKKLKKVWALSQVHFPVHLLCYDFFPLRVNVSY